MVNFKDLKPSTTALGNGVGAYCLIWAAMQRGAARVETADGPCGSLLEDPLRFASLPALDNVLVMPALPCKAILADKCFKERGLHVCTTLNNEARASLILLIATAWSIKY